MKPPNKQELSKPEWPGLATVKDKNRSMPEDERQSYVMAAYAVLASPSLNCRDYRECGNGYLMSEDRVSETKLQTGSNSQE
jgi:hypothetical protein